MRQLARRRPSAGVVIGVIALVVATSGTAFAAGQLVSGDSLIKKDSLSGDRLRTDSVTGKQIKLSSLGQVPSAKTAANAEELGGHPASYFTGGGSSGGSSGVTRSGLVTADGGQTVTLASFGPFTVTLKCNDDGGGTYDAEIDVTSTGSNSEAFGTPLTAGTAEEIDDAGPDSAFVDDAGGTLIDFVNAPDAWMGYLVDSIFMPGTTAPCAASLLVNPS
ncbi:MAG TPA: hypothetical protein VMF57_01055 [Solirubrobacteraceae bacterium]|nr:hypothetical protein [Solirubrobacteraceae bacterium]